jgi:hypothetical protein
MEAVDVEYSFEGIKYYSSSLLTDVWISGTG